MANVIVHQVGFQRSEALEQFSIEKLHALLRREQAGDRLWEVEVYFKIGSRSAVSKATGYSARIAIKVPGRHRRMVTSGEAVLTRPALMAALSKMEKRLRRESRKSESGRRTIGHTKRAARTLRRNPT